MNIQSHSVQLTQTGYDELVSELEIIKNNKLPKAIDRVARARDFGDLSENSEYHSAREDLAFLEGRLEELETLVNKAKIVKPSQNNTVGIGCTVTVKSNGHTHTYMVVGEYEADPVNKKISHDSPLGKALTGKKIGETVEFTAPVGKILYEIIEVK